MKIIFIRLCLITIMCFGFSAAGISQDNANCNIGSLPSIVLKPGVVCGNELAKAMLDAIAEQIINNPGCKVKISSATDFGKINQQLSWDRVNQVIQYFVEKKGIREGRFIFNYGVEGDVDVIDFTPTTEDGPSMQPPPFPPLSRLQKIRSGKCYY